MAGKLHKNQVTGGLCVAKDRRTKPMRARRARPSPPLQGPSKENIIHRATLLVLTGERDHAQAAIDALVKAHDASETADALPYDSVPTSHAVRKRIKRIKSIEGMEQLLHSDDEFRAKKINEAWGGAHPPQ